MKALEYRPTEGSEAYRNHYPVIAPLVMCHGLGDGKTTSCVVAQAATIDALRKGKTLDAPTDEMECASGIHFFITRAEAEDYEF